jgi:hypothetical protein
LLVAPFFYPKKSIIIVYNKKVLKRGSGKA